MVQRNGPEVRPIVNVFPAPVRRFGYGPVETEEIISSKTRAH